jgi:hypothetical protein
MITYVDPTVTFEQLCAEMKDICRFNGDQVFTMKWVDEEGELTLRIKKTTIFFHLLPKNSFQNL